MAAKRTNYEMPLGDILKEILQQNKLQAGMDQISVREVWAEVMGNGVQSYTQDIVLRGTTLYVALNSSILREELAMGKSKIIAMLNEALQGVVIRELVLR